MREPASTPEIVALLRPIFRSRDETVPHQIAAMLVDAQVDLDNEAICFQELVLNRDTEFSQYMLMTNMARAIAIARVLRLTGVRR